MNETVWIKLIENLPALVVAIGSVITAIGVILVGYWTYKTRAQVAGIETKVDGMSSNLVAATKAAAGAEGQLKERDAERAYQDGAPLDDPQLVKIVKPDIKE